MPKLARAISLKCQIFGKFAHIAKLVILAVQLIREAFKLPISLKRQIFGKFAYIAKLLVCARRPSASNLLAAGLLGAVLAGCGGGHYYGGFEPAGGSFGAQKPSTPATMRPYVVHGKRYYPAPVSIGDVQVGVASWYGPGFHGKLTSNGERFDTHSYTAAHKTMPMNTMVRVDNLENGRSVTVRINDRGPFVAGRIIDLSNAAAHAIDMTKKGTAKVRLSVVGLERMGASQGANQPLAPTAPAAPAPAAKSAKGTFTPVLNAALNAASAAAAAQLASSAREFLLQIGAFKALENARAFAAKQSRKSKIEHGADGLYRVYLAGFSSEQAAKEFAKAAKLAGAAIKAAQ